MKAARRYNRVKKLIAGLVGRFCRLYGLPFDEAWSAASLGFCQAYDSYDGRSKFSTWCQWKVEKRLTDLVRERAEERRELTGIDMTPFRARRQFDAASLFWRLDADGIEAVLTVLDPPGAVKVRAKKKGGTAAAFRGAIKRHLRESGWSDHRIEKTFRKVRRQL